MLQKLALLAITSLGLCLSATNAPALFRGGDEDCRAATQYNVNTGNIVDCPEIACTLATKKCERDDVQYLDDDDKMVTIVFCSCGSIDEDDIFEGAVCHAYRYHKGATTKMKCNKEGCDEGEECAPDSRVTTVRKCECKSATAVAVPFPN